jgi:hypothetical protein
MLNGLTIASETYTPQTITTDQLADICESMESAIVDISMEYEWLVETDQSLEERLDFAASKGFSVSIGSDKCKIICSINAFDPNDPDPPLFDKFLFEKSDTSMTDTETSWDNLTKKSYNGAISKSLYIGGSQGTSKDGHITGLDKPPHAQIFNPVKYFSVHRLRAIEKMPLSAVLRKQIVPIRINHAVKQIGVFDTISAEFIHTSTNKPFKQICFSVKHGFMPVKYEYLNVYTGEPTFTVEVTSSQEVRPGIWFPKSGLIKNHKDPHNWSNMYQATGPILVNQGLTDEQFDIDFPVGTEVHDEIQDRKYTVK